MKTLLPILALCLLTGCATVSPKTDSGRFKGGTLQDRLQFDRAYTQARKELMEARPDIVWVNVESVIITPTYPEGRNENGGYYNFGDESVHAVAVEDWHVVYTYPLSFRTAVHELKHIIAWGSGDKARAASLWHSEWMFPTYHGAMSDDEIVWKIFWDMVEEEE